MHLVERWVLMRLRAGMIHNMGLGDIAWKLTSHWSISTGFGLAIVQSQM
jgi:hypothetical protein